MNGYDGFLFLDILLTEGAQQLDTIVVEGLGIYYLTGPSGKRVQISIVEGENISKRICISYLKQLGLERLIERMFP